MAPHSSTLAWEIPWMEEPGRLQSMGSQRVGHDWATSLSFSLSCIGEGNGNPLQCSCLENPRDSGLLSMGSHRVGHDWSDLAAVAAICSKEIESIKKKLLVKRSPEPDSFTKVLYSLKEEYWSFLLLPQNKRKKEFFFIHYMKSPLFPYQIQRWYMKRKLQ